MPLPLRPLLMLITAAPLLGGCMATRASKVSVDYYSINGDSTAALDREIRNKGPRLDGGRHAVDQSLCQQ